MPIDRRDLVFLSQIPFQLSGEEHLSPGRWCFYLSFNWGIHKELPPSTAQRILTLALEEKILEKENETLTLKERKENPPLYKFGKKIYPKELIDVKPYPIKNKIEYNEVELQIQEKTMKKEKEKEPLTERLQKPKKRSRTPKEEVKEEKPREEKQAEEKPKEGIKEEKPKQKTKPGKKQKPKEDKPELTLDHFTKT